MNQSVEVSREAMRHTSKGFMQLVRDVLDVGHGLFEHDLPEDGDFVDRSHRQTDADIAFINAWDPAIVALAHLMDQLRAGLESVGDAFAGMVKLFNLADDAAMEAVDQILPTTTSTSTSSIVHGSHR
jgi:hypothetical protein